MRGEAENEPVMFEDQGCVGGFVPRQTTLDERSLAAGSLGPGDAVSRFNGEVSCHRGSSRTITGFYSFGPQAPLKVPLPCYDEQTVKKGIAAFLFLAALGVAGRLAWQAVERERDYQRLITQGDEALVRGQPFVAVEAFSGAIALKPGSMLGYLKRGEAHQRRGESVDTLMAALRDLKTAVEIDPGATRALEELGDVNFKLQRYQNAAASYESYLRLDDRSAVVFYKLGLAARGDGRLMNAVTPLQQAVRLNPSFAEAHYALGLCLKERGQLNDARAAFERAVHLSPAMIPAREELADLHRLQRRTAAEIEQLEALTALDSGKPERWIALGLAQMKGGRRDLAVAQLNRAAESFPDHPGVYAAAGQVWLQAAEGGADPADLRKAIEAFEKISAQPAASSEVLGLYGRALVLAGELPQAERVLQRASERLPTDPEVLPQLAAVSEELGHFEQARGALIRYAALVDDDAEEASHAAQIADLSMQLNDPAAAVHWYERSDAAEPADGAHLARLAEAQLRSGHAQDARITLIRAVSEDPDDPQVKAMLRRIPSAAPAAAPPTPPVSQAPPPTASVPQVPSPAPQTPPAETPADQTR
jgi:tetratricopeptide (TPR) repeat protein